ncbi:MAG: hypothetical protein AAF581_15950 [Planctomycetota bacterium]
MNLFRFIAAGTNQRHSQRRDNPVPDIDRHTPPPTEVPEPPCIPEVERPKDIGDHRPSTRDDIF